MEYKIEWCDSNGIEWVKHIFGTFEDACAFAIAPTESDSVRAKVFLDGGLDDDVEIWSYDGKAL